MPQPASSPGTATSSRQGWSVLLLFIGATGIAFAPLFAKLAYDAEKLAGGGISPPAIAFWRFALSIPLILMIYRPAKKQDGANFKTWYLLLPGLFFALDLSCWHWAFEFTSLANATLEANLAAVIVPLFGFFVLKEKLGKGFAIGASCAVIGLIGLVLSGQRLSGFHWLGDALGIATAFFYSGYLLSVKLLTRRWSPSQIMLFTAVVASLVILLGLTVYYRGDLGAALIPANPQTWWSLVGLAIFPQIFGQLLVARAMIQLPVAFASVALLWQPVVSAWLGWWVLGQSLGALQMLSGMVVLLGIFVAKNSISRTSSQSVTRTVSGDHPRTEPSKA